MALRVRIFDFVKKKRSSRLLTEVVLWVRIFDFNVEFDFDFDLISSPSISPCANRFGGGSFPTFWLFGSCRTSIALVLILSRVVRQLPITSEGSVDDLKRSLDFDAPF